MFTLFAVCAAVGGTVLVIQLVLTLTGLGGDMHGDVSGDVHIGFDHGGDFHAGDIHSGDMHTGDLHASDAGHAHGQNAAQTHDSGWLFQVITFRTLVAAATFFGLAGLAAQSSEASIPITLAVAVAAGVAAMYGVFWMMRGLTMLRHEGTARIERAVGRRASVYLHIPPQNSGTGRIQINLQNRTMEYSATTAGDEIPTGATVEIVEILDPNTVRVEPVTERV
jgi:hypothetical protein